MRGARCFSDVSAMFAHPHGRLFQSTLVCRTHGMQQVALVNGFTLKKFFSQQHVASCRPCVPYVPILPDLPYILPSVACFQLKV